MLKKLLAIFILGAIGWVLFLGEATELKKAELEGFGADKASILQFFDN